jgi:proteasome lid subunit RPN8/RPN11
MRMRWLTALLFVVIMLGCASEANVGGPDFVFSDEAYNAIITAAQDNPEVEVGGLLGGKDNNINAAIVVPNSSINKAVEIEYSKKDAANALSKLKDAKQNALGTWHTHPRGNASPSYYDAAGLDSATDGYWHNKIFAIYSISENRLTLWRYPSREELEGQPEKITAYPVSYIVEPREVQPVIITKD